MVHALIVVQKNMRGNWLHLLIFGILPCLLVSCGYDYDSKQVTLKRGEGYRGHRLSKVEADGVRLVTLGSEEYGSTFYSRAGRPHMNGFHSLGNNEDMRVVSVDPAAQKADLEFMWLDWVGPLTMPPF